MPKRLWRPPALAWSFFCCRVPIRKEMFFEISGDQTHYRPSQGEGEGAFSFLEFHRVMDEEMKPKGNRRSSEVLC